MYPELLRKEVLWKDHVTTRSNARKAPQQMRTTWYCPKMTKDVRKMFDLCNQCSNARPPPALDEQRSPRTGRPWPKVRIWVVRYLPETGRRNSWILFVIDRFTRGRGGITLSSNDAGAVAIALAERVFGYVETPEVINTGQRMGVTKRLPSAMCQLWEANHANEPMQFLGFFLSNANVTRALGDYVHVLLLDRDLTDWSQLVPQVTRDIRSVLPPADRSSTNQTDLSEVLETLDKHACKVEVNGQACTHKDSQLKLV